VQKAELERFKGGKSEGFREVKIIIIIFRVVSNREIDF
jgi:hypothetical protein